jgi:hypothetical protein
MQKLKLRFLVQRRLGHIVEIEIKCDLITLYICEQKKTRKEYDTNF